MKKHILLVILLVVCLIPTGVAIISYNQTQAAPVDERTAVRMSINDADGKDFVFERENSDADDNMILFFLNMQKNATSVVALPDSLTGQQPFKVVMSTNVKDETYQYYFTQDPTVAYFVNPKGEAYHIAEADAASFIGTEYAQSIYEAAAMPVLTLSGEYAVAPDSAVWQYKNYSGTYVDSDVSGVVTEERENYSLEGGFSLAFDEEPDYFTLKVTDQTGAVLYDDIYTDIASLFTFDSNTQLQMDVVARWYEDSARSFCGELNYSFSSLVTAPAEFYLGKTSVERGGFVAVTATNVLNPEKIQFSCEPSLGVTPTFYADGEYAVALIPVDKDLAAGGYVMTFTYGGTRQDITLQVEDKTYGTSNVSVSSTLLSLYRTKDTISEFEEAFAEITGTSEETRYFSGMFDIGSSFMLLRGFGRHIVINNDSSNTYRNNGIDYQANTGTSVTAANAGKVCYVGILNYTGNLVVIDHGLGLKTWYYNMGSFSVAVGDIVQRGDVIGTCGATGFSTFSSGVHIAMSVGSQFVSPYDVYQASTDKKVIIWGVEE